jgi:hypothetical protein
MIDQNMISKMDMNVSCDPAPVPCRHCLVWQLDGWMADPSLLFGCRSDVLGQVMPLVGKDWTQSGVARLFSSIKVL